ncbi:MAG TPA: substrate-binding domain-containing protein [Amycolatopsis sp.]|nr:substrate-binding domain-containing protein [Amycolatopsis sp.]
MADVARLAGVSHQTVSRVINAPDGVRPEVRQRVEQAIKELRYQPNAAARALARQRTMNLGVVSIGTSQYGPATTLFGIAEAAREAGYATSLVSLAVIDRQHMKTALEHLVADSVAGIIVLAPVATAVTAVHGLSPDVPLVLFEPGVHDGVTSVAVDETLGARLATRHLLELGHDTVWHVSGPEGWLGTDARIRGWRAELAAARRVAHEVIAGDWSADSGYRVGQRIARDPEITAVFTANDQMALGLLLALREHGRAVNEISVVGFDDIPESAFYQPPLTTVRLDFTEVGHRCVDRLLELIRGEAPAPKPPVQPELVVRGSTAPPAN